MDLVGWLLITGFLEGESSYVKYTFAQKEKKTKQISSQPIGQEKKKFGGFFVRKNCDGKKGGGNYLQLTR